MAFRHGVQTIELPDAGGTVAVNLSCVIALIGVSPVGPVNTLTLCNNARDDAQFGEATPDNNIAKTLATIRSVVRGASTQPSDGSCPVVVVNTYSAELNAFPFNTSIAVDASGKGAAISQTIIGTLADVRLYSDEEMTTGINEAAEGAYVYGEDYTLDRYGNFVDITGTYKSTTIYISGDFSLSAGDVTAAQLIGGIDESDVRTGISLFDLCETTYGFKPKIFLAPTYNTLTGVAAALEAMATSKRGVHLSDASNGISVNDAVALRSGGGIWDTSAKSCMPLFPWLKMYDAFVGADVAYPYSAVMAGMIVATDNNVGFWESPSNKRMPGVKGVACLLTSGVSDGNSEATLLNSRGITTYRNGYGTGYMTWGNRNASYPTSSDVTSFVALYRADGMVADTMEAAAAPYVDKPITKVFINIMKQTGNNVLKSLIQRGGVLPGSEVTYRAEDNTVEDLAAGKVRFYRNYMIPTPAEDIGFINHLDIQLLRSVGS